MIATVDFRFANAAVRSELMRFFLIRAIDRFILTSRQFRLFDSILCLHSHLLTHELHECVRHECLLQCQHEHRPFEPLTQVCYRCIRMEICKLNHAELCLDRLLHRPLLTFNNMYNNCREHFRQRLCLAF